MMPVCVCGQECVQKYFDALDVDGVVVRMFGLTCPTPGCEGNTAERCEARVQEWRATAR